jgi:hypothetical protein
MRVDVRLWPRVEIGRCFVLSELRRILLVEQNRVENQWPFLRQGKQVMSGEWVDAEFLVVQVAGLLEPQG